MPDGQTQMPSYGRKKLDQSLWAVVTQRAKNVLHMNRAGKNPDRLNMTTVT